MCMLATGKSIEPNESENEYVQVPRWYAYELDPHCLHTDRCLCRLCDHNPIMRRLLSGVNPAVNVHIVVIAPWVWI